MRIKYDIPKIKRLLNDVRTLTGICIDFLDTEMNALSHEKPDTDYCTYIQKNNYYDINCKLSDFNILKKSSESQMLEMHICPAGLYDFAMPIIKNNITAGYIIMGRIRSTLSPEAPIISDCAEAEELYAKLPYFTEAQIESLKTLIPEILFQSAIEIEYDSLVDEITGYISQNLDIDITVNKICKHFYVSKNSLYAMFKDYYNCTVNEYIINERLKKAKQLIKETRQPLYEISSMSGFDNYPYFCKLFKRKTGLSPMEYRSKI